MTEMDFASCVQQQRHFFNSGATRSLDFRRQQLSALANLLATHEADFLHALHLDLNKPTTESLLSELYLLKQEIAFTLRHLASWMKAKRVSPSLPFNWPGKSYQLPEPYGVSLIIAPWNYPLLMALLPAIGSMASGNCVLIKPSEVATATQDLLCNLLSEYFPSNYLHVVKADATSTQHLLQESFDHIFFTGSSTVGKIIMQAASQRLTPVTLELGGKSPCIVDHTANVKHAAKKILWAKMTNAGQVCIAPDFVLIEQPKLTPFLEACKVTLIEFYGDNPKESTNFSRIINAAHVKRLKRLLNHETPFIGGDIDEIERYVAPTIIVNPSWHSPLMQDEIFGPLLPILPYQDLGSTILKLKTLPKPLACYIFSNDQQATDLITHTLSFGTACINDCLTQITNPSLPFGGVGHSGMGQYRGYASFQTFSHYKSIFKRPSWFNVPIAYPPYTQTKLKWLRRLLWF